MKKNTQKTFNEYGEFNKDGKLIKLNFVLTNDKAVARRFKPHEDIFLSHYFLDKPLTLHAKKKYKEFKSRKANDLLNNFKSRLKKELSIKNSQILNEYCPIQFLGFHKDPTSKLCNSIVYIDKKVNNNNEYTLQGLHEYGAISLDEYITHEDYLVYIDLVKEKIIQLCNKGYSPRIKGKCYYYTDIESNFKSEKLANTTDNKKFKIISSEIINSNNLFKIRAAKEMCEKSRLLFNLDEDSEC